MLGTAAHKLGEHCILEGANPRDLIGVRIAVKEEFPTQMLEGDEAGEDYESHGFALFEVDDAMCDGVEVHLRAVGMAVAFLCERGDCVPSDVEWQVEQSLHAVLGKHIHPETGGTGDWTGVVQLAWGAVVDYKNGRWVVEVEDNEQLMEYALGLLLDNPGLEGVRTYITQPNAPHEEGPIRWRDYTREQLIAFGEVLKKAAVAATTEMDADELRANLKTGEHCSWCEVGDSGRCPAVDDAAEELLTDAGLDFEDEPPDVSKPKDVQAAVANYVSSMADDLPRLARFLRWGPFIEAWVKGYNALALRLALEGKEIEDRKIVRKGTKRKFAVDEDELYKALAKELKAVGKKKADLVDEPRLKTPAAIERLGKDIKAKLANADPDKGPVLVTKPVGALTLAPASDKRPAVDLAEAAAADFPDDDEEEADE